jgi:hypothetical protein
VGFLSRLSQLAQPTAADRVAAWIFGFVGVGVVAYSAANRWVPGLLVGAVITIVFGLRAAGAMSVAARVDQGGLAAGAGFSGEAAVSGVSAPTPEFDFEIPDPEIPDPQPEQDASGGASEA